MEPVGGAGRGEGSAGIRHLRGGRMALALCRSLNASITSCIAWLGISASPG